MAIAVRAEHLQDRLKQDALKLPTRGLPPRMEETLLNAYTRLSDQFHGFIGALEKIHTDATLSPTGQAQKRAASATQWEKDLRWLPALMTDAKAALARLSGIAYALPPITPKRDPLIQFFREQEARSLFADLSESERIAMFLKAMAKGDGETIHAFLDAPGGSLISEEVQTRTLRQYAEGANPTVVATLDNTQALLEQLQGLSDHVNLWLAGLGADPVAMASRTAEAA